MVKKLLAVNSVLLFAISLTWLFIFGCICIHDSYIISEPNTFILGLEIAMFILILCTALFSMIYVAKRG